MKKLFVILLLLVTLNATSQNKTVVLKVASVDAANYLTKADSLSGGYTTWLRTKKVVDSLAALKVNYTDTAAMMAASPRVNRFLDSLTNVQARIQTKQPLGAYITLADSSTILAGRWLPNRSADSIAVIRALANTKGLGSVTSIATNTGSGITGGTITSTGTIAADTAILSTKANVTALLLGKLSGNQTITLSGDVSGSGATAITTAIGALKVTNAMLAGSIDYAKMNAATVPTWNQNTTGTAANVTGVVAIANGGTGSATQNFVDLTTAQTVGGAKTFSNQFNVASTIRSTAALAPASGSGLEFQFNGSSGNIFAYNRTTPAYFPLNIDATTLALNSATGGATTIGGTLGVTGAATFSSRINVNGATDDGTTALKVTGAGTFSGSSFAQRSIMNNSTQTQAEFWGWNNIQGASANAGEIRLGGTESIQGRLIYASAGNTTLYLDNTFNDAAAEIKLRTRVAGTAVEVLKLQSQAAVFSGTLGINGTADNVKSGTYTPTLTNYNLVSAATAYQCQYMRVGNVVTVSGKVSITATNPGNTSSIYMSVPISSTLGTDANAGGTFGLGGNDPNGVILAGTTDTVLFSFVPSSTANNPYWFTFTYLIN